MDDGERLEAYCYDNARRAGHPGYLVTEDNPLLTPAQKRRLRKKRHVGHSHAEARLQQAPCVLCRSPSTHTHYVGGVPWTSPR